jgi:hypothetical protein
MGWMGWQRGYVKGFPVLLNYDDAEGGMLLHKLRHGRNERGVVHFESRDRDFFFRDPKERYVTIKAILRSGVAFRRRRLHWRWGSCEGGGLGSVTGDDETNGRLSESEEEEE